MYILIQEYGRVKSPRKLQDTRPLAYPTWGNDISHQNKAKSRENLYATWLNRKKPFKQLAYIISQGFRLFSQCDMPVAWWPVIFDALVSFTYESSFAKETSAASKKMNRSKGSNSWGHSGVPKAKPLIHVSKHTAPGHLGASFTCWQNWMNCTLQSWGNTCLFEIGQLSKKRGRKKLCSC
jgi:hypothetical protein